MSRARIAVAPRWRTRTITQARFDYRCMSASPSECAARSARFAPQAALACAVNLQTNKHLAIRSAHDLTRHLTDSRRHAPLPPLPVPALATVPLTPLAAGVPPALAPAVARDARRGPPLAALVPLVAVMLGRPETGRTASAIESSGPCGAATVSAFPVRSAPPHPAAKHTLTTDTAAQRITPSSHRTCRPRSSAQPAIYRASPQPSAC